jgi:hypothetical protein
VGGCRASAITTESLLWTRGRDDGRDRYVQGKANLVAEDLAALGALAMPQAAVQAQMQASRRSSRCL